VAASDAEPNGPGLQAFIQILTQESNDPLGTGTAASTQRKGHNTATEVAIQQQIERYGAVHPKQSYAVWRERILDELVIIVIVLIQKQVMRKLQPLPELKESLLKRLTSEL